MRNEKSSLNEIAPFLLAERHAENCLLSYGHQILARNFAVHNIGEIDIISLKKGKIYATEVKARTKFASEYVDRQTFLPAKRKRIVRTLHCFLHSNGQENRPLAILSAEVIWDKNQAIESCRFRNWE